MKKRLPWKRFFWALVLFALCVQLWLEFDIAFLFIAGVFAFGVVGGLTKIWWSARREKRRMEDGEAAQEDQRRKEIECRREACREARYHRGEQERIKAHIEKALGLVDAWDLEKGADALCLDVALVPPTETLSFWKAATMGAGAYTMAGGYAVNPTRAELVMALPPDWDPADRWPVRVLRDAARSFVVGEGFVGYNSVYRGFSAINAGFAGAIVTDDFPGLPDLGSAAMPGAPAVSFFWLVPLLKPELDYFRQRGLSGLERRFSKAAPWADSHRKPVVDPLTWFDEDIAPFTWSQDGELYCLGLEIGERRREPFPKAGHADLAWDWEKLAREYLRRYQPDDLPFVEFACEERVFFAASRDEEIMRKLALGLSDLLRNRPEEARRMLC